MFVWPSAGPRYPAAIQYLRDPQTGFVHPTPVILFHLCPKFVSSLLSCSTKTGAWGLLAIVTNQPHIFFLFLRMMVGETFFFLKQKQNSFGAWEKILDEETIFMLTWLVSCRRRVRYNMVRVKLFFTHHLHFVMKINENKSLLITSSFTVVCILP